MPMSTRPSVRLKALALAITFVVGGGSVPAADMLRHHLNLVEQHDGRRHVEQPGTCLDHQHQCDLGLSVSGPKLTFPPRVHLQPNQDTRLAIRPVHLQSPALLSLLRLPESRAPPHLG